jgi:tetratricopeptide (TPR) repeat protein
MIAEAHAVLGGVNLGFEWRWQQSEADLKRAIELNSNYARAHQIYAELLTVLGDFDKATSEVSCAIELDPLAPAAYFVAGWVMYSGRQYAQAHSQCVKALEIDPAFFPAHLLAGLVFEREGQFTRAVESLVRAVLRAHSRLRESRMVRVRCSVNAKESAQTSMCLLYQSQLLALHSGNTTPRSPAWKKGCDSVAHEQSGVRSIPVSTY